MFKNREGKAKTFFRKIYSKYFGFEEGIDITNEVELLHRRNTVIKNIILVSNLVFSGLLFMLSISGTKSTDWFYTLMSFPITYIVNKLLTSLISNDVNNLTKQQTASYVASFYMFLSTVLIYGRLHSEPIFETAGYVLIFYALIVISLYQSKKMLSVLFWALFTFVTIIHFLWTYNVSSLAEGKTVFEFLLFFTKTEEFFGLLMRTAVFSMFYFALFAIVSIGQYMQEERKKELILRQDVQGDFSNVVSELFSSILIDGYIIEDNEFYIKQISMLTELLGNINSMSEKEIKEMRQFSIIQSHFNEIKEILEQSKGVDDKTYEKLLQKSTLGAEVVKRIQLIKKADVILRSYVEESINENLVKEMLNIQPDKKSQLIVLADLYLKFRGSTTYKRPYNHTHFVKAINGEIGYFFDPFIVSRISTFNDEINKLYEDFTNFELDKR